MFTPSFIFYDNGPLFADIFIAYQNMRDGKYDCESNQRNTRQHDAAEQKNTRRNDGYR